MAWWVDWACVRNSMDCRRLRAWGSLMSTDQSRIIYPSNKMAEDSDVLFYISFQNGLKIQHLYHQHTCLPQTEHQFFTCCSFFLIFATGTPQDSLLNMLIRSLTMESSKWSKVLTPIGNISDIRTQNIPFMITTSGQNAYKPHNMTSFQLRFP